MKIYKYSLDDAPVATLRLTKGSQILTVQAQHNRPKVWVLYNDTPGAEEEDVKILIYGTGTEVDTDKIGRYIGTFQLFNGDLVFHVFEQDKTIDKGFLPRR